MFKKHEIGVVILSALIIGFITSFRNLQTYEISTLITFLKSSGLALIVVSLCIITSKIAALKFGCDADFRLWTLERFGFHHRHYLKTPIPAWLLFPLFLIFITWGAIQWLALFVFETAHTTRVFKDANYTDITEWEVSLIAFYGLLANIILAVISQFLGWHNFALLNIWFAFFNMLPISELNGMKIFHGSIKLWIFSFILTSIILILLNVAKSTTNLLPAIIGAVIVGLVAIIAFFHFLER